MKSVKRILALLLCLLLIHAFAACGGNGTMSAKPAATAEITVENVEPAASPAVADASQMTTVEEVVEEGMTPVFADSLLEGDYPVAVKSSSSMFRVEKAELHVRAGSMSVTLTMSGTAYLYVYPGTAMEAATGDENRRIPYTEDEAGAYCFTLPVEALDAGFACAAFSRNKELWYDRTLLLRADSLPPEAFREGFFITAESLGLRDGDYTVEVRLAGGSGRASVASPAKLAVRDGGCTAEIIWGSKNYDYMRVGEEKLLPMEDGEFSVFLVPVLYFDRPMPVVADTVAMSEPHEIAYTLYFDAASLEQAS